MPTTRFEFVNQVVAHLGLVVARADAHSCRLEPGRSELAWHCDLDDGTPTGDNDPAAFVRWICPSLRVNPLATGPGVPVIDVRRSGPQSDLGKLVQPFRRLFGQGPASAPTADRFHYTDPAGILDADLRRRIENWPPAPHGDGVVRPAELWSITLGDEGLVLESVSWWDSAHALDHQLRLAVDIARRLTAHP